MIDSNISPPYDIQEGYSCAKVPPLKQERRTLGQENSFQGRHFQVTLPDEVLWRTKMEFAAGCGSERFITDLVEDEILNAEFEREKELFKRINISSKEELCYFRIFKSFFNTDGEIEFIGRWKGGFAPECADL